MSRTLDLSHNICLIPSLLFFFFGLSNAAYSVVDFGARPDGLSDSTQAFKKAWAKACGSTRAMTLYVPKGKYVVRPINFNGPCKSRVNVLIKGTILAPPDYRVLGQSRTWLLFYGVNGLTVKGGTIDARGAGYWSCKRHHGNCNIGAQSISFIGCNDIVVDGLTSYNSQRMHVGIVGGRNAALKYLTLRAPGGSPNTDGIHLQDTSGVTIVGSVIKTGDDCISIGPGTRDVWIQQIACGPGHGISIGSLGNSIHEAGVQNITVTGVVFWKTQNGVRIKSWARPSNGFVRGVIFRNLVMNNVYNPIIIDQNYCLNNQCPHQNSGVKISGVKYRNIKGTSKSKVAVSFDCSPSSPCTGIKLQDIKLTYNHSPAVSSCSHIHGSTKGAVIPRSCF
ncbi:hypothetical protein Cgig2_021799 [Carnegiea gigantea]|uniref:Polygalacturonase n=1 Tax=Carnegiea gigantea TaxID=171969 RepID=A0A9Q1K9J6_9CARY|nr:hypothetical protein Cgig2_021799 [Carnegiea gigantea]